MVSKFIRRLTLLFLIFIPFQRLIGFYLKMPGEFYWADEFFVLIILFIGLAWIRKINRAGFLFLGGIVFFCLLGFISGTANGNPLRVTALGTFDYMKNFLVIPFVGVFFAKKEEFIKLYQTLHVLALVFSIVAVIQLICRLAGVPLHLTGEAMHIHYRFGFIRISSLLGHPNIFGFYTLLFFLMDINLHRKPRWQNVLFFLGIVLSTSRMVWAAAAACLVIVLLPVKRRSREIKPFFVAGVVVFLVGLYIVTVHSGTGDEFRSYTFSKSVDLIKEHFLWGVGPGMYGGPISLMFDSPIYEKYSFSPHWFQTIRAYRSIDQFWMQALAEMGLLGTAAFLTLFFLLFRIPLKVSRSGHEDVDFRRMMAGLSYVPLILGVFLFGSGLNVPAFLLTATMMLGAALGSARCASIPFWPKTKDITAGSTKKD